MEWTVGFIAMALLVFGLVGQAFEMRKIRQSIIHDKELSSVSIFGNKRNYKWYSIIGVALVLWFIAERA